MMMKKIRNGKISTAILCTLLIAGLAGCSSASQSSSSVQTEETDAVSQASETESTAADANTADTVSAVQIDTEDMFTDRDLQQTPDTSDAQTITVSDGQDVSITEEGTYVITGTASDCTITVDAEDAKVQLVLDGVSITNTDFPAIYVKAADKCFVTAADGESTLSVTGSYVSDGDTNTDAAIFSKADLVLNGTGTVTVSSSEGNGITSKDTLKATGGTISIEASDDGINAAQKSTACDLLIEIDGGSLTINMGDGDTDALDSNGSLVINDGTIDITAQFAFDYNTSAELNGGTVTVNGETVTEITESGPGGGGQTGNMPGGGSGGMMGPGGSGSTPSGGGSTVHGSGSAL